MAEQTTTTKQAVWNPPQLIVIGSSGSTQGGSRTGDWEGKCPGPLTLYRMPTSGEPTDGSHLSC